MRAVTIIAAAAVAAIAGTAAPTAAAPAAGQTIVAHLPGVIGYGYNEYGEVGGGTTAIRPTPVPVALPAFPSVSVRQLSLGLQEDNAAVLMADGTVYTWGENNVGELATGPRPTAPPPRRWPA